jgi:hypothetical protein
MNAPPAAEMAPPANPAKTWPSVSHLVRRVHLYLGLFFAPWMLMYALSTLVMTHRDYVMSFYATKDPVLVAERELDYTRTFPTNLTREEIGRQVLQDIGLEGSHSVSGGRNSRPLVITRQHAPMSRRITFDAGTHKLTIQREEFRTPTFLERMHRRRGYAQPFAAADTWGFSVDVAVVAMAFWSLSGVWLWWELKATRAWGALSLGAGIGLFAIFVALI